MPEREILHGSSYASLLEEAGKRLREWIAHGSVVVIARTRAAADEFVRQQVQSGAVGLHRFTLSQFAANLAAPAMAARGLCMVSGLTPVALSARVTHQVRSSGLLTYFNPVAGMPGFARVLASTIAELRAQRVRLADLAQAGDSGHDLAPLLKAYEDELDSRSLADPALIYRLAAEAAEIDPAPQLAQCPLLFLDVEVAHACERRFVSSLADRASRIIALCLDGDERGKANWEQVLKVPPRSIAASRTSQLDSVREWLFSPQVPTLAPADESVQFFAAPGEATECVEIARRMLALASRGRAFDECAILLRDPARYQALVEEALRRAAIPAHFSRGANRPDPGGRSFLALLACAAEGCSASRFSEYLSLGQLPAREPAQADDWEAPADDTLTAQAEPLAQPQDDGPPQWNAGYAWEKLLVDAGVIGGPHRWKRRLDGLDNEFQLKLASAERDDPASIERIERRREQLANLRNFAIPLIETLADLPKSAHWGVWLAKLGELARASLRYPGSVLSVLAELEPMDEAGPVALDEVYRVLEDRLRFFRQESEGRRYGKVFVGSIEEARGRAFEVVFLPGLAEGVFPRPPFENPLLLDRERARLAAGLDTQDDRAARERFLLLSAVAATARSLIWSYPNLDTTLSRTRVPSFYALELLRASEGRLPGLAAFQKRSAAASETRLNWPAPEDTDRAIDDAEYDLATLRRVLAREPVKGALRYLVDLSPSLGRSLRTRWRRSHANWNESDGLVKLDPAALAALEPFALKRRPYSASALENFAACPYRFALRSIFGLRPREDSAPLEQMDPITRGELFHAVQFALFQDLQSRGGLPVTLNSLPEAIEAADRALDRLAAEFAERIAPAIERIWEAEVENLRTDLRAWLRDVAERDSDWLPMRFEYGFGIPRNNAEEHDSTSVDDPATICDGFLIRGSIDMVEEHSKTGALRVVDHKTGRPPERRPLAVGGGDCLQPLLYSLAGESLWKRPVESGRLYYCTQRGGYQQIDIPSNAQSRGHLRSVLDTIGGMIQEGFLPAAPAEKACERCDYRSVCGPHEEDRVKRKPRAEIENLVTLRRLP